MEIFYVEQKIKIFVLLGRNSFPPDLPEYPLRQIGRANCFLSNRMGIGKDIQIFFAVLLSTIPSLPHIVPSVK